MSLVQEANGMASRWIQVKYLSSLRPRQKNIARRLRNSKKRVQGRQLSEKNQSPIDLILITATDCNMMCKYCYANHGNYGYPPQLMSFSTAERAIDVMERLTTVMHSISFFGGEPLLNFPLIEKTVPHIRTRHEDAIIRINTNGTLISETVIEIIKKYKIGIVLSLDGPKVINDQLRFLRIKREATTQ